MGRMDTRNCTGRTRSIKRSIYQASGGTTKIKLSPVGPRLAMEQAHASEYESLERKESGAFIAETTISPPKSA